MSRRRAGLAGLVLAALLASVWLLANARHYQSMGTLISRVPSSEAVVALTFDDGPTAQFTGAVLSQLRKRGVKATFFVTGRETEAAIDSARRIVEDGHELGNHSYSHPRMLFKTPGQIAEEIERTDAAIRSAGHEGEILFRPPYGKKLLMLPWYLARNDRKTIMWDVEPESSKHTAQYADRIAAHVIDQVRPGSIVLMHVMYASRAESRKALPLIIDGLHARGYSFVTVSELMRRKNGAPPPANPEAAR